MDVSYHLETYPELDVDEFIDVLKRSTLAERRASWANLETIRRHASRSRRYHRDRQDGRSIGWHLAGVLLIITFAPTSPTSGASHQEYRGARGIGKELIRRTHRGSRASHHAGPAGRPWGDAHTIPMSECRHTTHVGSFPG